ncbi:MAG: ClpXP protease specificity-enhancing factor SspB [Nitrospiraceae bacterium]|nr:ClpXP protease specificity-enhancing factor SspB [Nitrospiraceae bacterium]
MSAVLNELKRQTFFSFLDAAGRVFIHVKPSGGAVIGERGFMPDEMEKGIVLVFNRKMAFDWGQQGIAATLVFGSSPQKCFIPADDIIAVFSPELEARLVLDPPGGEPRKGGPLPPAERKTPAAEGSGDGKEKKLIKVDFRKKKT